MIFRNKIETMFCKIDQNQTQLNYQRNELALKLFTFCKEQIGN